MMPVIGTRNYTCFTQNDLSFTEKTNYLFSLDYLSLLHVSGAQAADFLQGQLTCDIRLVQDDRMQQGALCNLKGRILALMDIFKRDDAYYLMMPQDLSEATFHSLERFALLSRCQLQTVMPRNIYGLWIQDSNAENLVSFISLPEQTYDLIQHASHTIYKIDSSLFILISHEDHFSKQIENLFQKNNAYYGSLAWHYHQLYHHHIEIYPSTRGQFLPHRLNLQDTAYLSFNKGCYKGQEIIARTHYKATLKHHLVFFEVDGAYAPEAGSLILDQKTQTEIGEVVDCAPTPAQNCLIAATVFKNCDIAALKSYLETQDCS